MMTTNSINKLHDLSCLGFPDSPTLKDVDPGDTLILAWQRMTQAAGVDIQQFLQVLSDITGIGLAASLQASEDALQLLPAAKAQELLVLPLEFNKGILTLALANPCDEHLIQQVSFITNHRCEFLLAEPEALQDAIQLAYSQRTNSDSEELGVLSINADDIVLESNPIIRLAKQLLLQVVKLRASDLHLQPFLGGGVARARVDGLLRRLTLLPSAEYDQLCRFFKANSGMDPSNSRTPQDGRLSLDLEGHDYDLRLSALPAKGGERIVIRLLDLSRGFKLSGNGFSLTEVQALRRLAGNRSGILLITGPTGSGKTSTLYSLLGELNSSFRNIITVENPVEYVLQGLSQIEVNDKAGLSFAAALRSALRQDPDILLIGEIRDEETANIAFQAALTGHLVLSTLHSNNAMSTVPRLLDLGVQPAVLADALIGVVAQRLCRKLCKLCRVPVTEPLQPDEAAFYGVTRIAPAFRPDGCEACAYTGYAGRFPIAEIIELSSSMRRNIAHETISSWEAGPTELNSINSLSSSVARHVISGETSVAEAARVIGQRFWPDIAAEYKTTTPDIAITLEEQEIHSPGVLILGNGNAEETPIAAELERAWFDVHRANNPAEARKALEQHDDIVHVIVNIDNALNDDEVIDYIHRARVDMAWSRLPALLLIPNGRPHLIAALTAAGATSPCLLKPVSAAAVARFSRQALSRTNSVMSS